MFNASSGGLKTAAFRPSKQSALVMGGITGLILIASIGGYFWQSAEIQRIQKEVDAKLDEVHSQERTTKQLGQLQEEASGIEGKLHFLERNVSSGTYIPTMVQQMAKRAQSYKLLVTSSRHSIEVIPPPPPLTREERRAGKKPPPPPPYNKARIEIDLVGTYGNVARFIHSLTRFEKIITVNSVQEQSRLNVTNASPDLSVHLSMTGYVFPDDETATGQKQGEKLGSISERRALENQIMSQPTPQPK